MKRIPNTEQQSKRLQVLVTIDWFYFKQQNNTSKCVSKSIRRYLSLLIVDPNQFQLGTLFMRFLAIYRNTFFLIPYILNHTQYFIMKTEPWFASENYAKNKNCTKK